MKRVMLVSVVLGTMLFSAGAHAKIFMFAGCYYSQSANQNDGKPILLYCPNVKSQSKARVAFDPKLVPGKLKHLIVNQEIEE